MARHANGCFTTREERTRLQPRWVLYLILSVSILFIVAVAMATGILVGYIFCYIMNHLGYETAIRRPSYTPVDSNEAGGRTINGAISNLLMQKLMRHHIWKNSTNT